MVDQKRLRLDHLRKRRKSSDLIIRVFRPTAFARLADQLLNYTEHPPFLLRRFRDDSDRRKSFFFFPDARTKTRPC